MNYFGDEEEVWVTGWYDPQHRTQAGPGSRRRPSSGEAQHALALRHHITLLPLTELQVHNAAPWPRLPPAPHLAPSLAFSQGLLLSHSSRL